MKKVHSRVEALAEQACDIWTAEKNPYECWKLIEHRDNGKENIIARYKTAKELEAFLEGILWTKGLM